MTNLYICTGETIVSSVLFRVHLELIWNERRASVMSFQYKAHLNFTLRRIWLSFYRYKRLNCGGFNTVSFDQVHLQLRYSAPLINLGIPPDDRRQQ